MAEALARRGHDVHVAAYHLGQTLQSDAPFTVHRIANVPFYKKTSAGPSYGKLFLLDPMLAAKVARIIRDHRIDIIHAHHVEGLVAAYIPARKSGLPLIYDAHTTLASEIGYFPMGLPARVSLGAALMLDRRLPRGADHVVAVSEEIRAELRRADIMPERRISVIPNGVESDHFLASADAVERRDILYAGSLAPYHRIDLLLDIFARLLAQRPDARLRIVTDEDFAPHLPQCERLGITHALTLVRGGYAQLPDQFARAAVAVNTRIEAAGLPQKLLNYMAGGLPVVSFAGSTRHLVDGVQGRVIADGDCDAFVQALADYLDMPDRARQHGENGRALARQRFSWDGVAERLEQLYESLSPPPLHLTSPATLADVSAVIVNYNGGERIERTVSALFALPHPPRSICVVDNGSTDGSPERLRDAFPQLLMVNLAVNSGLPAARNAGLRHVPPGPVLMLDADVYVTPGCIERMLAALQSENVGIACPRILYYPELTTVQCDGAEPHFLGTMTLRDAERPLMAGGPGASDAATAMVPHPVAPADVDACIGACMMVDRDTVLAAGGFDERFFFYFEDLEFSLKMRALGLRILCCRDAIVHHDRGLGTPGLSYRGKGNYPERRAYLSMRHRLLVIFTHYQLTTILLLSPALILYELATYAFRSDWRPAWRKSWAWQFANRSEIRAERAAAQARRRMPDHRLLRGGPIPVAPGLVDGAVTRTALRCLSAILNANWLLVQPILRLRR